MPPYIPHPQFIMLGGLFQFEDSAWHVATVWGAGAVVLSIPVWLWLVRKDTGKQLLAVQLLFDILRCVAQQSKHAKELVHAVPSNMLLVVVRIACNARSTSLACFDLECDRSAWALSASQSSTR